MFEALDFLQFQKVKFQVVVQQYSGFVFADVEDVMIAVAVVEPIKT